jgi:hypothetical protein
MMVVSTNSDVEGPGIVWVVRLMHGLKELSMWTFLTEAAARQFYEEKGKLELQEGGFGADGCDGCRLTKPREMQIELCTSTKQYSSPNRGRRNNPRGMLRDPRNSIWITAARQHLLRFYPQPPFVYLYEGPTANTVKGCSSQRHITPDISIWLDERLIAIIEVGHLHDDDRLEDLKRIHQQAAIHYIPHADLLYIVQPEIDAFRLARQGWRQT